MTFTTLITNAIVGILAIIVAWFTIKKTRVYISTLIIEQVSELAEAQSRRIKELTENIVLLDALIARQEMEFNLQTKRVAELERHARDHDERDKVRDVRELNLTKYIEYLLNGVRVLISQVCKLEVMPEFDPVGLEDFLAGDIG